MKWYGKVLVVIAFYAVVIACGTVAPDPTTEPTPDYGAYMATAEALQTAYAQAMTDQAR